MLNVFALYSKVQKTNGFCIFLIGCIVLLVASIACLASVPPVSRDALTHHLAVPKLYLKYGSIYEIPTIEFSYYPMNLDLLYMIPLYFGNDIIPKFIHFSFAILTACLIFGYLRKRTNMIGGLLGALFFLSLPVIIKLSITVYVDLGLIFFSTAALIYLFKWIETDFKWKHLIVSAVFCGLAMGTKYNGLITLFLLTVFIVFIYARSSANSLKEQSKAIGAGIIFMLVALIVFSPWAIRNYHWTHNPIYPLHNSWFNSKKVESDSGLLDTAADDDIEKPNHLLKRSSDGWTNFAVRKIIFKEKWWEIALIPIRIFFQGEDDNPKYFDGRLNPLMFFLPIIAFFNFKTDLISLRREKSVLLIFSILYIFFAFFQVDMRIRYIAPVIPPLVILSVMGLHSTVLFIQDRLTGAKRWLTSGSVIAVVILLLTFNLRYLVAQFHYVKPMSYISGELKRDDYIARYREEYPAIQFINRHLPPTVQILALGLGNRIYYGDRRMDCDSDFFKTAIAAAVSADSLADILLSRGYSHLLIRHNYFRHFIYDRMDDKKRLVYDHFRESKAKELFNGQGYQVLKIKGLEVVPTAKYEN